MQRLEPQWRKLLKNSSSGKVRSERLGSLFAGAARSCCVLMLTGGARIIQYGGPGLPTALHLPPMRKLVPDSGVQGTGRVFCLKS
jgi:hypothetical protein